MTTESVQFRPSPWPRAGAWAFIGGAWMNRRYTRLSSTSSQSPSESTLIRGMLFRIAGHPPTRLGDTP